MASNAMVGIMEVNVMANYKFISDAVHMTVINSVCYSVRNPIHMPVDNFVCFSIRYFVSTSIYRSVYLAVYDSVYFPVYFSVSNSVDHQSIVRSLTL